MVCVRKQILINFVNLWANHNSPLCVHFKGILITGIMYHTVCLWRWNFNECPSICAINGLFTLVGTDSDTYSDSDSKPDGYIVPCRNFRTVSSQIQIPVLTAEHRNGIWAQSLGPSPCPAMELSHKAAWHAILWVIIIFLFYDIWITLK